MQIRKSRHAASRSRKFYAKIPQTNCKIPEFWRAHLANVRSTNLVTSLQLSVKSMICSDPNKCASDVMIMQNLRKKMPKISRKNCKTSGISARHAHRFFLLSASRRCATRMTSLKFSTGSTVRADSKKQARGVKITQILCENLANELQIYRNSARPAQNELRALGYLPL